MQKDRNKTGAAAYPGIARPVVGSVLTAVSAVAFLFLFMILPLVGSAGQAAAIPYAGKNFAFFLFVLLVCMALAGMAVASKLARRRLDGSPLPYASLGLLGMGAVLLLLLVSGALRI